MTHKNLGSDMGDDWEAYPIALEYVRMISVYGEKGEGWYHTTHDITPAAKTLIARGHAEAHGNVVTPTLKGVLWWGWYVSVRVEGAATFSLNNVCTALARMLPEARCYARLSSRKRQKMIIALAEQYGATRFNDAQERNTPA